MIKVKNVTYGYSSGIEIMGRIHNIRKLFYNVQSKKDNMITTETKRTP